MKQNKYSGMENTTRKIYPFSNRPVKTDVQKYGFSHTRCLNAWFKADQMVACRDTFGKRYHC